MAVTAQKIVFAGRVQGVGFRFTAYNIAKRCRLTGCVKNLPDGSVEMLAQGTSEDIADCISDIKQAMRNYITEVKIEDVPCDKIFRDFKITF